MVAGNDHEGGRVMGESSRVFTIRPPGPPFSRGSIGCCVGVTRNFPSKEAS